MDTLLAHIDFSRLTVEEQERLNDGREVAGIWLDADRVHISLSEEWTTAEHVAVVDAAHARLVDVVSRVSESNRKLADVLQGLVEQARAGSAWFDEALSAVECRPYSVDFHHAAAPHSFNEHLVLTTMRRLTGAWRRPVVTGRPTRIANKGEFFEVDFDGAPSPGVIGIAKAPTDHASEFGECIDCGLPLRDCSCPSCICDGSGSVVTCVDDLCRGAGWCMHGDGEAYCEACS